MNSKLTLLAVLSLATCLAAGPTWAKKAGGSKADYRSAKSGQYVKKDYAGKHKNTTVREERKKK